MQHILIVNIYLKSMSDTILKSTAYGIDRNRGYEGFQRRLAIVVCKYFDTKIGSGMCVNEQIAE